MTVTLLRPLAEADLVERTRYYRREGGDELGGRFFDAAVAALTAIGRMPGAGSPRVGELCDIPGLRIRRVVGFPCGWFYFVTDDHVDVVRLLHGRETWDAARMPAITGRLEVNLSVRDPVSSAKWYARLLGMRQRYDYTSDDGRMRYVCLIEPASELVLCLVGHAANPGDEFSEFRTGLDHLEFVVERREDLLEWADRLHEMGVPHSGVRKLDYTPNAMLTFRDPDNIQLEFFWRAPSEMDE